MALEPAHSRSPDRLIVIGASAGGLAPLRTITSALPASLPATVLVVMHISSTANSVLPEILARSADVGVAPAYDGLEMRPGRVIVAPPDRHLMVLDGRVQLDRGPRENGHRPAVDPLFRSAAEQYGARCCGVILSGSRDDGVAGLAQIKAHGGLTVVQDPEEAQYDGMPANALAAMEVDHLLAASAIPEVLVRFASGDLDPPGERALVPSTADEMLSILCPECGGTLFSDDEAGVHHFHCHSGHKYSVRSLLAAHAESVERAMWTAVRSLEDRATLLRRMAQRAETQGAAYSQHRFEAQARASEEQAQSIRDAVAALDDTEIEPMSDPNGATS
jgi:two-component system chemotaxis response regulator CheB